MHAGDPGHGGHGAVHGDARPVHEERAGLRAGVLHHGAVHVQRPAGPARADPAGEGQGRRAHGAGGQQVRPGGRARGRQAAGRQPRQPLQLRVHGDLRQGQDQCQRGVLRPSATDQQKVPQRGEDTEEQKVHMPTAVRDRLHRT